MTRLGEHVSFVRQMSGLGLAACDHRLMVRLAGQRADDPEGTIEHQLSRLFARRVLRYFGLPVETAGTELVRGLERYCVVSSHASYLDWAVLLGYFPSPLRFIAKRELGWLPVVGSYLKRRGVLINRRSGIGARRAIRMVLEDGQPWPILIFPEGTRSVDGQIRPFHRGGLRLLIEAGLDMVPVCLLGTHRALPPGARLVQRGVPLRMIVGAPVRLRDMASAREAAAEVERRIRQMFAEGPASPCSSAAAESGAPGSSAGGLPGEVRSFPEAAPPL